jgi:hypothetical protein
MEQIVQRDCGLAVGGKPQPAVGNSQCRGRGHEKRVKSADVWETRAVHSGGVPDQKTLTPIPF